MKLLYALVLIFSFFSGSILSAQTVNREKIFHFSLNGPDDTLDLVQGIRLKYAGSPYASGVASADTNRFGEANSAVRLTGTYFEILNNNQFNLDEDSAVTVSFWLKSNSEYPFYELLDFFRWVPLNITNYNTIIILPDNNIPFDGGNDLLHFLFTYDKGNYRFYLNSELRYESRSEYTKVTTTNEKITIGTSHSNYTLDELIMYKGALSDDEVRMLYHDNDIILSNAGRNKTENDLRLSLSDGMLIFSDMVENLEVRQMNGTLIVKSDNAQKARVHSANELLIVKYQYKGLPYTRKMIANTNNR